MERRLPKSLYQRLFKFAFVRNPWARMVSQYHFLLERVDHRRHRYVVRLHDFDAYVEYALRRSDSAQYPRLVDSTGSVGVDLLGRFEDLTGDFTKICGRLALRAELPHLNVSRPVDYRSFYSPSLRDRVAEALRQDVETFGYDF